MNARRQDIQGLRAFAVLLVMADHVTGRPAGGFVGVDVFFVISGFLITRLLLREHERTGRISLTAFYRRRARRIVPVALVVGLATVVVASVTFARARFESVMVDAAWAALCSSNWRSVLNGTDYLHATDAVSPLQHYWSLAVEEQFYFIWPVVLLGVVTVFNGRRRSGAAAAVTAIAVVSLGFGLWETAAHPAAAYFSTFSRAWELAAGAMVAVAAGRLAQVPRRARPPLLWAGLVAIGASALLIRPDSAFPVPLAVVPVAGAIMVIVSGTGAKQEPWSPLRLPVFQHLGDASYSLYLWHFPVLVFTTVVLAGMGRHIIVISLIVTVALAFASYHWIERPVLAGGPRRALLRPVVATAVMLVFCATAAQATPAVPAAATPGPAVTRASADAAVQARWQEVDSAASARTWPALSPSMDLVGLGDVVPEWRRSACAGLRDETGPERAARWRRCTFGRQSASKLAVVVGDSISISWVSGLRAALVPRGYRVQVMSIEQCPSTDILVNATDGSFLEGCASARDETFDQIEALRPNLVIASETPLTIFRLHDGATDADAAAEWQAGERRTLDRLSTAADRVVVLLAPPIRTGEACSPRRRAPGGCLLDRPYAYEAVADADGQAVAAANATVVDTTSWFCTAEGTCPSFIGSSPVLADGEHLTGPQSLGLADVLAVTLGARARD